ncbi:FAD-dependent oxidoreductase [Lentzea sp. NPDC059081]|uniref:FAD-dependent oxidoreductase n=1 Tax=Lentzea sp. NPDC059081 TaxID=3346719 RepID=UPI0036C6E84A
MNGHAVVLGAGIGGLASAAALSAHFSEVTVVERDVLPDTAGTRRGVPQGAQVHGLLARGLEAFEELFPGFVAELREFGAPQGDLLADMHWYFDGHLLHPATSGLTGFGISRPALEQVLRRRVRALPNVRVRDGSTARRLVAGGARVTGVELDEHRLDADLVVDTTGRATRSPVWLRELGYPAPHREDVRVGICYVTHLLRRRPEHLGGRLGAALASYPGRPRGAFVLAQEGSTFAVTTSGRHGVVPPVDHRGLVNWVDRLGVAEVTDVVATTEPLAEARLMRYPASSRHRYERLSRFPEGYLVMGDALCSFNPVYGQGMTVAATEALLLRRLLAAGADRLARRFFREAALLLDAPWQLASGGDLRFEPQSAVDKLVNAYRSTLYRSAASDPVLSKRLFRVANLLDPPSRLMGPSTVARVLRGTMRR